MLLCVSRPLLGERLLPASRRRQKRKEYQIGGDRPLERCVPAGTCVERACVCVRVEVRLWGWNNRGEQEVRSGGEAAAKQQRRVEEAKASEGAGKAATRPVGRAVQRPAERGGGGGGGCIERWKAGERREARSFPGVAWSSPSKRALPRLGSDASRRFLRLRPCRRPPRDRFRRTLARC